MGIIEDLNRLYQEGKSDQETASSLQQQGYNTRDIYDAMSRSQIKKAVSQSDSQTTEYQTENPDMQQSVMSAPSQEAQKQPSQEAQPPVQQGYPPQYDPAYQQYQQALPQEYSVQQYPQYDSYQNTGSDTISEIAEQIVNEKLGEIRTKIESFINVKNDFESRILILDERLKRVEKIIDRLQLSIIQKVGEYVTNVEDIKKELTESQKSFKTLLNQKQDYKQL